MNEPRFAIPQRDVITWQVWGAELNISAELNTLSNDVACLFCFDRYYKLVALHDLCLRVSARLQHGDVRRRGLLTTSLHIAEARLTSKWVQIICPRFFRRYFPHHYRRPTNHQRG